MIYRNGSIIKSSHFWDFYMFMLYSWRTWYSIAKIKNDRILLYTTTNVEIAHLQCLRKLFLDFVSLVNCRIKLILTGREIAIVHMRGHSSPPPVHPLLCRCTRPTFQTTPPQFQRGMRLMGNCMQWFCALFKLEKSLCGCMRVDAGVDQIREKTALTTMKYLQVSKNYRNGNITLSI